MTNPHGSQLVRYCGDPVAGAHPLARVEEARHALAARGAEIAWWVYEGTGHGIADGEVRLVEDLLAGTRRMVVGTSAA